jgi:hypothetical protein
VIEARIAKAGLRLKLGQDVQVVNPESDARFRQYWETYHHIMGRDGITPEAGQGGGAALQHADRRAGRAPGRRRRHAVRHGRAASSTTCSTCAT